MEKRTDWETIRERRLLLLIIFSVLIFLILSLWLFHVLRPITVHFINIDQGDSCLIQAGTEGAVLIDGGDVGSGKTLETYFHIQNVKCLDAVFISHFHQDHVAGILELLEAKFPISQIYLSQHQSFTELEAELFQAAKTNHVPVTRIKESQEIIIGKVTYRVISQEPFESEDKLNNMSMILQVAYNGSSLLFTGDIEKDGSERLVSEHRKDLDVDVLKIPHHGGSSSASGSLITTTSPEYSVISLGVENQYGNPADITLAYLLKEGSKIYRTDRDGTITMTLGKNGIKNISYSNRWR